MIDPSSMSRRAIYVLVLLFLVLLAAAAAPWTLSGGGIAQSVAQQLRNRYGVTLEVRGRSTIAALPVPRIKFEGVTLSTRDGALRADGGILRGELRLLPLLLGRVEIAEIGLDQSSLLIDPAKLGGIGVKAPLVALTDTTAKGPHIRRLVLSSSAVSWSAEQDGRIDNVGLVLTWPAADEAMELVGWGSWRGERVEIARASAVPAVLAEGRPSPFTLKLVAPSGQVTTSGEFEVGSDPRITGQALVQASSVRDFARWSGIGLPLGSLMRTVSVEGDFVADRRRIAWPSVLVTLGSDKLDGTLSRTA